MQHDGTLENFPFRGSLYIHAKAPREQLLQNNHKHGSRPKDFNKNKDTSKNKVPPQATIYLPLPKVKLVQFDDPYNHIRYMENNHEDKQLKLQSSTYN